MTLSEKKWLFSGWYVDNVSNVDMAPYFSPYARNFRIDWNSVKIRPWHFLFTTLTTGSYPKGITGYLRATDSDNRLVVRHNQAYTPAYLTGGTAATSDFATWASVTDGSFKISVDGTLRTMTGIDFTWVTSMADVATKLQTALRAQTGSLETVIWSTNRFIISSVNVTSSSAITVTTAWWAWTDVSWAWATAYMDSDTWWTGVAVTNAITNKLVSITTAWVVTPINTSTNIASDNKMKFINTNDNLYCMNWSDPYGKLNGTTYTTINQAAIDFKGSGTKGDLLALPQNTTAHTYIIEITSNASPDVFKWNVDGGGYTTGVNCATTDITLDANMKIKFQNATWHTVWDKWTIYSRMAPAFGVMFNGSAFVAWSPYLPSRVFKSSGTDIESFSGIGSDTFTFQEKLTGLSATTQWLFYFTKNSISVTGMSDVQDTSGVVSYITRVMNAKEWAVNHDSIVECGTDIYYLTPNNNINKLIRGQNYNGYEEVELSQRSNAGISGIMQSLDPDQTSSFGYLLPKENLIKRHLKSLWASFNDTVIIYDTIKEAFIPDTNKYWYDACVFDSTYYACSMVESKIFLDEYSFADENSPIPFVYYTKEFFISDPTLKKQLWETRTQVEINELAELKQEIWLDWALKDSKTVTKSNITDLSASGLGTTTIGTESIGTEWPFGSSIPNDLYEVDILRTKGNLNTRFKKMQVRFSNTTIAGKVKLKAFNVKLEVLPPETTSTTK